MKYPGQVEVFAGDHTRFVKSSLPRVHELIYPPIEKFWDDAINGSS